MSTPAPSKRAAKTNGQTLDFARLTKLTPVQQAALGQVFGVEAWNGTQTTAAAGVQTGLTTACESILLNVPPCPDRTLAIGYLRQASMLANAAITTRGRY